MLSVKSPNGDNDYCHEAELYLDDQMVGKVVYRPDKPLSCGAQCWLEMEANVEVRCVTKEIKHVKPGFAGNEVRGGGGLAGGL